MALEDIIVNDNSLKKDGEREKRIEFISLAKLFDEDLASNIELTSIELDDKYESDNLSGWQRFLQHSPVKKYINGFMDEKAYKLAGKTLRESVDKASDALKIKQAIEAKDKGEDNSNIVVWFMPQKDYTHS